MTEEWRDIDGYEGLYQVSNLGRVKSLNYNHTGTEKIMKPYKNTWGYLKVSLSKERKNKLISIHRLVAKAFISNPDNLPQVNHINEVKTDNRAVNLEWCNARYNSNYGTRNIRALDTKSQRGVSCGEKKIKQISLTGEVIYIWNSASEAGRNGYKTQCVSACCRGDGYHKTYKGYKWEFV